MHGRGAGTSDGRCHASIVPDGVSTARRTASRTPASSHHALVSKVSRRSAPLAEMSYSSGGVDGVEAQHTKPPAYGANIETDIVDGVAVRTRRFRSTTNTRVAPPCVPSTAMLPSGKKRGANGAPAVPVSVVVQSPQVQSSDGVRQTASPTPG